MLSGSHVVGEIVIDRSHACTSLVTLSTLQTPWRVGAIGEK